MRSRMEQRSRQPIPKRRSSPPGLREYRVGLNSYRCRPDSLLRRAPARRRVSPTNLERRDSRGCGATVGLQHIDVPMVVAVLEERCLSAKGKRRVTRGLNPDLPATVVRKRELIGCAERCLMPNEHDWAGTSLWPDWGYRSESGHSFRCRWCVASAKSYPGRQVRINGGPHKEKHQRRGSSQGRESNRPPSRARRSRDQLRHRDNLFSTGVAIRQVRRHPRGFCFRQGVVEVCCYLFARQMSSSVHELRGPPSSGHSADIMM
jgi:hypothetical protein